MRTNAFLSVTLAMAAPPGAGEAPGEGGGIDAGMWVGRATVGGAPRRVGGHDTPIGLPHPVSDVLMAHTQPSVSRAHSESVNPFKQFTGRDREVVAACSGYRLRPWTSGWREAMRRWWPGRRGRPASPKSSTRPGSELFGRTCWGTGESGPCRPAGIWNRQRRHLELEMLTPVNTNCVQHL